MGLGGVGRCEEVKSSYRVNGWASHKVGGPFSVVSDPFRHHTQFINGHLFLASSFILVLTIFKTVCLRLFFN